MFYDEGVRNKKQFQGKGVKHFFWKVSRTGSLGAKSLQM